MKNDMKKMPATKGIEELSEEEIDELPISDEGDSSFKDDSSEDDIMEDNKGESSEEEDGYDDGEGEDDILEDLEEKASNKRKFDEDESETNNKSKRTKHVKPPTAEEMMNLRETENLFHSSLFRLQIAEMLSELKPKKNVKRFIGPWTEKLKTFLTELDASDSYTLSDNSWLKNFKIYCPLKKKDSRNYDKGIFKFQPPVDVFTIGSHCYGCPLTPSHSVDIAVVIPKNFILHDDNLNQRYYFKRALYLCYIAGKLRDDSDLLSSDHKIEFTHLSGDPFKPILVVHPAGKITLLTVRIFPVLQENSFNFKRLLPSKNNVRSDWWGLKKDILPPTPLYNASIIEDLVFTQNHALKKDMFDQNQNVKDAFVLLRVWLKQRGVNQGYGSFTSHITAMLLVYLMKNRKINKFMSSYQIIRHFWLYMGDSDWTEDGPTICEAKIEGAPEKDEFHLYHDLVFVDASGYFNLAARLNKYIYLQVKEESKLAIQHLDNQSINGFDVLFMTKMPFIRQYDIVLWFTTKVMKLVVDTHGDEVNVMNLNGEIAPEFLRLVTEVLEKGISHRLSSIGIQFPETPSWDIAVYNNSSDCVKIGLNLDVSTALSLIDKGPEANALGAEEFREFWKEKCDLRRFKDGTVCESVVWADNEATIEERRSITNCIVNHLLSTKLSIPLVRNVSKYFEKIEKHQMFKLKLHQLEETSNEINLAFEDLSRQLRDLPDLPLSVVSVHCISPVYRFTDPFPPVKPLGKLGETIDPLINDPNKGILFSDSGKIGKSPQYIAPIDCVVQMALSSKWPEDIQAQRMLMTSFSDAITKGLKKHCNLPCQLSKGCFIVNKNGYLFRLFLGNNREIGLLKLQITKEGVRQYRDTPESLYLEKKFINLPKITGALYRLSEEHPGFSSATRLAKRWFCSQLIDDYHFPQVLIELLMAHIFVTPQPYKSCLGTLPGFLRFLSFISTTDWSIVPVIVNFNSLLTSDDIQEMEKTFREERSSFPPLFLATSYDRSGSLWSKSAPTLPTLVRLGQLAKASLQILEAHLFEHSKFDTISNVFRPPMAVYDAVISLRDAFQLRASERFFDSPCKKFLANKVVVKDPILPILEFNPVDLYLSNLRDSFGEEVLFFHDTFGGKEIGVLFKPTFFENFKHQNALLSEKKGNEDMILTFKQHLDYAFHNFTILGNGIVEKIELRRLKCEDESSISPSYYAS